MQGISCKRCMDTKWVLYKIPAKQVDPIRYANKDYCLDYAKRCPDCTRAKESSWDKDFKSADGWEKTNLKWEDIA